MMRTLKHLIAAALVACVAQIATAQDRPRVIAVNAALHYFADRLVGDSADVTFPVPAGVDPSFWRPSIADISAVQSADLILLNGAGFATWVDRVSLPRSKLVNTSAAIKDQFIVTQSITHSHGDGGTHSHEGLASYLWLDPTLAIAQAEAIANALTARDLAPAKDVADRLDALRADLEALDAQTRAALEASQGLTFIATHPRYEYFARRYGLSITSLEWEAGAAPTDTQIQALSKRVQQTNAQVLIWEATPPAGAFETTAALGLQNVVFAPMAQMVDAQPYLESVAASVAGLSQANAD